MNTTQLSHIQTKFSSQDRFDALQAQHMQSMPIYREYEEIEGEEERDLK